MARKSFTQAQTDLTNMQSGDYVNEFYLKKDKETNFIKLLTTKIDDMEIHSIHQVALTSPKTGKTYYNKVDCLGDGCPLCKEALKNTKAVSKARDMVFIPIIQIYNDKGEFEPSYKIFSRSVRWMAENLVGFEARYGLEGIIEVERVGEKLKTAYNLYDARKGKNGEALPDLPDIDQLKEDFEVKDDDVCGRPTSLVRTWDEGMCDLYIETGSPYVPKEDNEVKEEVPRRRSF